MENFTQQILNILIAPPGNLVYHLILAFSVVATIQSVLIGRKSNNLPYPGRLLLGLVLVLLAQLALFLSSGLAWQQVASPQRFLPPLDRAVMAFSLVWIIWLWCFPTRARLADMVTGVLSLVVVILALFTINYWMTQDPSLAFNGSMYDWGWELFSLSITFLGMMILFISRPEGWGVGLAMLSLILIGWVANLLLVMPNGDFSGIVRLAQLCAYPLLPALSQRLAESTQHRESGLLDEEAEETKRSDPRSILAWVQVAAENNPENIHADVARAIAQTMHSDLCFTVASSNATGLWVFQGGYDLVKEETLPDITLDQEMIPILANALQRGRAIRLSADDARPAADLSNISQAFGLDDTGYLLAAPLISGGKVLGGVVLLTPYSNRPWSAEDQVFLVSTCEPLVHVLQRGQPGMSQSSGEAQRLQKDLETRQSQLDLLQQENEQLVARINSLKSEAGKPKQNDELVGLLALQKESQEIIANLQTENEHLQAALQEASLQESSAKTNELPKDETQLEKELRSSLRESAQLQNMLAEANVKIVLLQRQMEESAPAEHSETATRSQSQQEMIASIAQELRQPMTSIVGYSDLLLAELTGSINMQQRSYLDRIKSSIERMYSMLTDLVRVSTLDEGIPASLDLGPTDLNVIVDEAVKANTNLLQEKNLSLEVDIPDHLPELDADPEALTQMVVDLLRNAGSISPIDGTVTLRVSVEQNEQENSQLVIQVSDNGGGIPASDLPRVFTPLSQAGMPLVQGTADGGYGLVIAQTLARAHGGDIWVESDGEKTTAFTVKLPITNNGKTPETRLV